MRHRDVPIEPPEAEFPPWLRSTSHVWSEPTIDPNWHRDDRCPFEPNRLMDNPRPRARYKRVISPADASAWVMKFGKHKGVSLGRIMAKKGGPSYLRWLSRLAWLRRTDDILADMLDVLLGDKPRATAARPGDRLSPSRQRP